MSTLQLYLLGALDVRRDDQSLDKPPTLKSQSLLAYLALRRKRPQPCEHVAFLFWGDRPERKARSSLSTSLCHIIRQKRRVRRLRLSEMRLFGSQAESKKRIRMLKFRDAAF